MLGLCVPRPSTPRKAATVNVVCVGLERTCASVGRALAIKGTLKGTPERLAAAWKVEPRTAGRTRGSPEAGSEPIAQRVGLAAKGARVT